VRGRLAVAGSIAFAVILGSYLAYLASHPSQWTLDPGSGPPPGLGAGAGVSP
jgi:hypothetical protein